MQYLAIVTACFLTNHDPYCGLASRENITTQLLIIKSLSSIKYLTCKCRIAFCPEMSIMAKLYFQDQMCTITGNKNHAWEISKPSSLVNCHFEETGC
jgi:hypothetical protein